jgi:hypothetical protein
MKDTLALHLAVGFGAMAFSWVFAAVPLMNYGLAGSVITLFFWAGVVPLIMTSSGAIKRTISGNDDFIVIKLWSVAIALVICQFLVYRALITGRTSGITTIMILLLVLNMLEAVVTQYLNYQNTNNIIDLINPIIGLVLIAGVIKEYRHKRMYATGLDLHSGLSWTFIWGYSFWNLLFRSRLLANTSSFLFLMPSIVLPIATHYFGIGDWFQVRLVGLLMVLVFQLGITPGDGTIFSSYNTQGYNKTIDDANLISQVQKEDWYEQGLLALGAISSVGTLVLT